MSEFIIGERDKRNGKVYYYHQVSYRVKINPEDKGKVRGTGPSRLINERTFLGTAGSIFNKCKGISHEEYEKEIKSFGLESALYNIACEIELPKILKEAFPGEVNGVSVSDFILVGAINRVCEPSPKTQIPNFLKKSFLPQIMKIEPKVFNSQNFWLAYDKVS